MKQAIYIEEWIETISEVQVEDRSSSPEDRRISSTDVSNIVGSSDAVIDDSKLSKEHFKTSKEGDLIDGNLQD